MKQLACGLLAVALLLSLAFARPMFATEQIQQFFTNVDMGQQWVGACYDGTTDYAGSSGYSHNFDEDFAEFPEEEGVIGFFKGAGNRSLSILFSTDSSATYTWLNNVNAIQDFDQFSTFNRQTDGELTVHLSDDGGTTWTDYSFDLDEWDLMTTGVAWGPFLVPRSDDWDAVNFTLTVNQDTRTGWENLATCADSNPWARIMVNLRLDLVANT